MKISDIVKTDSKAIEHTYNFIYNSLIGKSYFWAARHVGTEAWKNIINRWIYIVQDNRPLMNNGKWGRFDTQYMPRKYKIVLHRHIKNKIRNHDRK